jgi:hypothetical protein
MDASFSTIFSRIDVCRCSDVDAKFGSIYFAAASGSSAATEFGDDPVASRRSYCEAFESDRKGEVPGNVESFRGKLDVNSLNAVTHSQGSSENLRRLVMAMAIFEDVFTGASLFSSFGNSFWPATLPAGLFYFGNAE